MKTQTISASEIAKQICIRDNILLPNGTEENIEEGKLIEEVIEELSWKLGKENFEIYGLENKKPYEISQDMEKQTKCAKCGEEIREWDEKNKWWNWFDGGRECPHCKRIFCEDCASEGHFADMGKYCGYEFVGCDCCSWEATESEIERWSEKTLNPEQIRKIAKFLNKFIDNFENPKTPATLFRKISEGKYISYKPDLTTDSETIEFKNYKIDDYARIQAKVFSFCGDEIITLIGWNGEKQEWEKELIDGRNLILPELSDELFSESEPICDECHRKEENCRCKNYQDYEDYPDEEDWEDEDEEY